MAAVNSVTSSRLTLPAFSPRAVLMYSAALGGEGSVALQLREAAPGDSSASTAALAGIACHDPELLADLLHAASDLGDSDSVNSNSLATILGGGLTSDHSKSNSSEDFSDIAVLTKNTRQLEDDLPTSIAIKRIRPKAAVSPNRQGPQQCQVCNKVFGNASALAKHKLTHSDERKYICPMCSKAFKRQDHLNGHMLTHRNKKPYECKADGCGKSYCDARSLRRHTENHHHDGATSKPSRTKAPSGGCVRLPSITHTSKQKGQSSPSKCQSPIIRYHKLNGDEQLSPGKNQLSPLADSPGSDIDLKKDKGSPSNSPKRISPPPIIIQSRTSTTIPPKSPAAGKISPLIGRTKAWAIAIQHSASSQSKSGTTTTVPANAIIISKEFKPVECNLCHRKFKNIPALNGHMRLHGGYFKKDSESKKSEKKETSGPPLQTASVSVRALIEEKIISRRGGNAASSSFATPAAPLSARATSSGQFILPRPPVSISPAPSGSPARDSTLIELLKRGNKAGRLGSDPCKSAEPSHTKRCASDPGHESPGQSSGKNEFNFGVSLGSDDGYYSPALTDDAFQFANTPEHLDDLASLEDYASVAASIRDRSPVRFPSNRRLQAVLNSPLPEGIADFGAYHASEPSPKHGDSYHDSSVSYPTPPASHEAKSPNTAPPRASSPLSAAFFTATMSSAEEVEEALEEVLPEECPDSLDVYEALEDPNNQPVQYTESRMMLNSDDPLLSSSPKNFDQRRRASYQARLVRTNSTPSWPSSSGLKVEVEQNKSESLPDVFLSPNSIPPSPQRVSRKRPSAELKENRANVFKSIMRSNTLESHYTPSPMLNPHRYGQGLFVDFNADSSKSAEPEQPTPTSSDSQKPRINLGQEYQAIIPQMEQHLDDEYARADCREQLLWDPGINKFLEDNEVSVRLFLDLSVCCAMPAGVHSKEAALRVLADLEGDIQASLLKLMSPGSVASPGSSAELSIHEIASQAPAPPRWTPDEVELFLNGLREKDKDFFSIAQMLKTKSTKDCVQFYYLWKKVTKEYKTLFLRSWCPDGKSDKGPQDPNAPYASVYSPITITYEPDEFPCKICGKIFNKVKSRSAHMKSHRPPDSDAKRTKVDARTPDSNRSEPADILNPNLPEQCATAIFRI